MLIFNYVGMYLIYSVLICYISFTLENKAGKLSILAILSLGQICVIPLADINTTMQIIPTILCMFSWLGIAGIICSFFGGNIDFNRYFTDFLRYIVD